MWSLTLSGNANRSLFEDPTQYSGFSAATGLRAIYPNSRIERLRTPENSLGVIISECSRS